MDPRQAQAALADQELVPYVQTSIPMAKELLEACLGADIPAIIGTDDHCKSGCAPKVHLMVRADDVQRVAELMHTRWRELALKEGTFEPVTTAAAAPGAQDPDAEPPCPACGTAAPLVDGACSDCGLTLE